MYVKDVGETIKYGLRYRGRSGCHARVSPICDFLFLDAGMDQARDAETEGGVDERAEETRVEMTEGMAEGDFGPGGGFILLCVLGHKSALDRNIFSERRSNSTVRSASREMVQCSQRECETTIGRPFPMRFE
jgi:hypothetical protein